MTDRISTFSLTAGGSKTPAGAVDDDREQKDRVRNLALAGARERLDTVRKDWWREEADLPADWGYGRPREEARGAASAPDGKEAPIADRDGASPGPPPPAPSVGIPSEPSPVSEEKTARDAGGPDAPPVQAGPAAPEQPPSPDTPSPVSPAANAPPAVGGQAAEGSERAAPPAPPAAAPPAKPPAGGALRAERQEASVAPPGASAAELRDASPRRPEARVKQRFGTDIAAAFPEPAAAESRDQAGSVGAERPDGPPVLPPQDRPVPSAERSVASAGPKAF